MNKELASKRDELAESRPLPHGGESRADAFRSGFNYCYDLMESECEELSNSLMEVHRQLSIAKDALDKYTSNPDTWDKSKDEWYAVYAKEALEKIKESE